MKTIILLTVVVILTSCATDLHKVADALQNGQPAQLQIMEVEK